MKCSAARPAAAGARATSGGLHFMRGFAPPGHGYPTDMANPIETLTKVVGFGIQQGTKILGGAISTVTGGGGDDAPQQQETPEKRAARQRRASQQPKPLDDVTITRKVETELFRSAKVDKGKISVNTADGVVWLRG